MDALTIHWTDTKPTEPGWYWYQDMFMNNEGFEKGSVIVLFDGTGIRIPSGSTFHRYTAASLKGQWAGPINPPEA